MAKKDKEFGKWLATLLIPRKLSIKRYEFGITIKEGDFTDRIRYPQGTKTGDVTGIVNDYYRNLKQPK